MIICRKCGWQNVDGARYCDDCRAPLGRAAAVGPEPVPAEATQAAEQESTPEPAAVVASTPEVPPVTVLPPAPVSPPSASTPRTSPPAPVAPEPERQPTTKSSPQDPVTPASNTAPVGIGRRFQPLPEAQLVRTADVSEVARMPTAPGTPVHSIAAGIVLSVNDAGRVEAQDGEGRRYRYDGLAPASITVSAGSHVRAGDILGAVAADALEVRLTDSAGWPIDAVDALVGLPDPNELGYVAVGIGLGIDPDALDRELVGDTR